MFVFEWLNNQLLKMEWLSNSIKILVENVFGFSIQDTVRWKHSLFYL